MCTKSPTSAEHCALLTKGPARHGSCFANFHSFKLNSSCSYFSSAFWTGKEGHTVGQANSTSCSAEDVCKGIWWSTAVGKTQLKWPTVRKHDAYCSPLAWKWCRKQESTFLFVSACWEKVLPASGLHDGHVLAVCYPMVGMDKEGYKGLGGQRGWASRAALILQDAALVGPHVVQMGQSGWWLTIHQLITMSTLPEEVAMLLVSIPTGVTADDIYSLMPFSVALGDLRGEAPKQELWWPFKRFSSLFPCWEQKRGKKKSPFTEVVMQWVICCLMGVGPASLSAPQWFH